MLRNNKKTAIIMAAVLAVSVFLGIKPDVSMIKASSENKNSSKDCYAYGNVNGGDTVDRDDYTIIRAYLIGKISSIT